MRRANQVVAILYSILYALMLLGALSVISEVPADPFVILFLAVPVLLNWLSFAAWSRPASRIRQFDFVVGVVFALFLAAILATGVVRSEYGAFVSIVMFSPPVVMNFLSYFYWSAAA